MLVRRCHSTVDSTPVAGHCSNSPKGPGSSSLTGFMFLRTARAESRRSIDRVALVAGLVVIGIVFWSSPVKAEFETDFTIAESYLRLLADKSSILVDIPVRLTHRTAKVHTLANDCEMHLAGKAMDMRLGNPPSI